MTVVPEFQTEVLIRRGKAYILTIELVEGDSTISTIVEPIYTINLDIDEIAGALTKVYEAGNPKVPNKPLEEILKQPDVTIAAANVRNWKILSKNAVMYHLKWYPKSIHLLGSDPKYTLGFSFRESMGYIFPIETSTRKIAQTILDDIATRPEVLNPPDKPDAPYKVPKMENKNDGTVKTTPTLTDMMVAYAEDAVELGKRGFNIALDYSEESLKQVEAILDRYHKDLPKNKKDRPPEDRIWTIANGWAGYIGEVIRKTWGGEWVHESYSPPGATIILKIGSFDIFLPAKVYKRLVNGSEDNIWHLYQVLKAQFEAAGMISK